MQKQISNSRSRISQSIQKHSILITCFLVIILAAISYGRAIDFNFWYDDWGILFLTKYRLWEFTQWVWLVRHPGEAIIHSPTTYLYGFNNTWLQLHGLFLKIIASLTAGLALYGLTRSKKAFIIGSILFASYFGGIESYYFMAARLTAYLVILLNLTIYFISTSYYKSPILQIFLAYAFFAFATILEPVRMIFAIPVIIVWIASTQFLKHTFFSKSHILRQVFFIVICFVSLQITAAGRAFFGSTQSTGVGSIILGDLKKGNLYIFQVFFGSIGNLVNAWTHPTSQHFGNFAFYMYYYSMNGENILIGLFFVILTLVLALYFLIKRKGYSSTFILLILMIPALYMPSWIAQLTQDDLGVIFSVEAFHRYIAQSAGIFILLVAFVIVSLPDKFKISKIILIVFVTVINIYISVNLVNADYQIRGNAVSQPLFDKQERDIPKNVRKAFIWIESSKNIGLIINRFVGSEYGRMPFLISRNINNIQAVSAIGDDSVNSIFCTHTYKPYVHEQFWKIPDKPSDEPSSLNDIYAWDMIGPSTLNNITNEVRIRVVGLAPCLHKVQNIQITDGLTLASSGSTDALYRDNRQAISIYWEINNPAIKKITTGIALYDQLGMLIQQQKFGKMSQSINRNPYDTTVFVDKSKTAKTAIISQEICTDQCVKKEERINL